MRLSFVNFILEKGVLFNAILGGFVTTAILQSTKVAREIDGWELWNWSLSDLRFPSGFFLFVICGMLGYAYSQFRRLKALERRGAAGPAFQPPSLSLHSSVS
jgi:hypothetical protein